VSRVLLTVSIILFACFAPSVRADEGHGPRTYHRYPLQHASASDLDIVLSKLLPAVDAEARTAVDSRANELVVTGNPEAHRVVRQLIKSLDVRPDTAAQKVFRAYKVEKSKLDQTAQALKQRYRSPSAARITVDRSTSQLLVLATPETQDAVKVFLSTSHGTRSSEAPAPLSRPPIPKTATPYRLQNTRLEKVEPILRGIFGQRMVPERRGPGGFPGYVLTLGKEPGQLVELGLDHRRNQVFFEGDSRPVEQLQRLITALDSPRPRQGRAVRIVALRQAEMRKVRQAIDALEGSYSGETPALGKPPKPQDRRAEKSSDGAATGSLPRDGLIRMSGAIFRTAYQPDARREPPVAVKDPVPEVTRDIKERLGVADSDQNQSPDALTQREQGIDVDVETLPDLDVIILRGRDRDVKELTRIIEEIEKASQQAEPQIVVFPLKHVPSSTLATVIAGIQQELLTGRQGRATTAALAKPNALLVIGWGEALKAMLNLIEKLDQPVAPESQFRVFRLKHATAAAVSQTITQFYSNRPGLGPVVVTTPDARSNSVIVSGSAGDLAEIELLIQRIDVPTSEAVQQMRVFRLKNSLAADLAPVLEQAIRGGPTQGAQGRSAALELLTIDAQGRQLLKSGLLDQVQVTADAHTNTLLVSAPAQSMDLIAKLIEQLDGEPASVAQIKVFAIVNADASAMIQMLRALLGVPVGGARAPRLAGAEGETSLAPLRFAVDERTNSIIASGSAGDLAIVEAVLLRLDEADIEVRKSKIYRLRNAPAIDVANSINQFLRSERQVQQAGPGTLSPFRQIEHEVVVVPEPVSNSLILSATPRYFDEIEKLIQDLDAQPPQVMIQVLIAEVDLDNTEELGVELGLQDSLLFDRSLVSDIVTTTNQFTTAAGITTNQIIQSKTLDPGFNFNNEPLGNNGSDAALARRGNTAGQALANFGVGRVNGELGYGGLVLSAGSDAVNILIRALHQSRRLRVLSRPQIMTLDNQPAFVQVGERVPRIVSTQVTQQAVVNSIDLDNVGLILGVTPRVSPDHTVVMEIDAEKSSLGAIADGIPISILDNGQTIRSPRINTTTAQTTVSAADGQTIIIGGLITTRDEVINRKVPYLGDVPIFGVLFRFNSKTERRTELLIILTPHVVLNREDADQIKQEEAARMNWCLTDVHDLYGDIGVYDPAQCEKCDAETDVIFPDLNPFGLLKHHGASETPSPLLTPNGEYLLPGELPPADEGGQGQPTPSPEQVRPAPDAASSGNQLRWFPQPPHRVEREALPPGAIPAATSPATRIPATPRRRPPAPPSLGPPTGSAARPAG